jgi:integrase
MFADYKDTTDRLVSAFGKTRLVDDLAADDFEALRAAMAEQWGPHRLGTAIQMVRTVFKYAFESGLIDRPVRYGPQFKKPSASVLRRHRAQQGEKLFASEEIRRMMDAASPQLRAMILLGINCGFGNSDCGNLPLRAVDLEAGLIDYPRPKTGIARRCPLWAETIAALRDALTKRPVPKKEEDADLVFVTKYGESWAKEVADSPITKEMRKLLNKLDIDGQRNFYTLRHTFRTIADEAKDQPAIDYIMGHADPSIAGHYRERIDDSRLLAVAEYVRNWLFGDEPDDGNESNDDAPDDPPTEEGNGLSERRSPESSSDSSSSAGANESEERPRLRLFAG